MKKSGFTLIEMIIYVAISSLLVSSLIATSYTVYLLIHQITGTSSIQKEGDLLLSFVENATYSHSPLTLPASSYWPLSSSSITTTRLTIPFDKVSASFYIKNTYFLLEHYIPYEKSK